MQLGYNKVASFDSFPHLTGLPNLTAIYLEHNPIARDWEYRKRISRANPGIRQIDAFPV